MASEWKELRREDDDRRYLIEHSGTPELIISAWFSYDDGMRTAAWNELRRRRERGELDAPQLSELADIDKHNLGEG